MVLFITLHIIMLKSECVLPLMGIFNALPQLILSGKRAHGEYPLWRKCLGMRGYVAREKHGTSRSGKGAMEAGETNASHPPASRQMTCFMDCSSLSPLPAQKTDLGIQDPERAVSPAFETLLYQFLAVCLVSKMGRITWQLPSQDSCEISVIQWT